MIKRVCYVYMYVCPDMECSWPGYIISCEKVVHFEKLREFVNIWKIKQG